MFKKSTKLIPAACLLILCMALAGQAGQNVALKGTTTSSTVGYGWLDKYAIDGDLDLGWHSDTDDALVDRWLEIELDQGYNLEKILIYSRVDCCWKRTGGVVVRVLDSNLNEIYLSDPIDRDATFSGSVHTFDNDGAGFENARYIRLEGGSEPWTNIMEVEAYALLSEAYSPNPVDGATDIARDDTVLAWTPGAKADQHEVYFGTNFDDVNDATTQSSVFMGSQDPNTFALDRLELGQTYYWRVDEISAPPNSTISKGKVWQFTAEPFVYPLDATNITATASSSNSEGEGPENTINASGLDENDLHSEAGTGMWLSSGDDPNVAWIQFEFDRAYKLHEMLIWNHNTTLEFVLGFGIKDAAIEYSVDGVNWIALGDVEFVQAPGNAGYAQNTTGDLSGVVAKYVKITASSNWGGVFPQFGLSEVRFLYIPVLPREPMPLSGTVDMDVDNVTLSWRPGREAGLHEVYLSNNAQTVIEGTALVATVAEASYDTGELDLGQTYYWKVNEVNETEIPTSWQSGVWNFSTLEYLTVDDFEDYNDLEPDRIFDTWTDGWDVETNGATMGNPSPNFDLDEHFVETTIVHSGDQSSPFSYDNTAGATYSEATRTVDALRDWTQHDIKSLTLWFYGDPNNSATEQMYVKVNGSKVPYDGDAEDLTRARWQPWNIELADFAVDLSNVTELSIGLEPIGAVGGSGVVYFDDIRLYPKVDEMITPMDPGSDNLVGAWSFDEGSGAVAVDSSGNNRNGTVVDATWSTGKLGSAVGLNGTSAYVNIDGFKGINADRTDPNNPIQQPFSVACWINTAVDGALVTWGSSDGTGVGGQYQSFRIHGGTLRAEHGNGNLRGNTPVSDGEWHHAALTVVEGGNLRVPQNRLYVDGQEDTVFSGSNNIYNLTEDADVSIGQRASHGDRFFTGLIDEVKIYDRALSPGELLWFVGRTTPIHKPF